MNNAEIEQSAIERYGTPRRLEEISEEELRQAIVSTDNPRPDFDTLKRLIRTMSFEEIGRIYGVTGAAVKKWCKKYELPYRRKDILSYSDREWGQGLFNLDIKPICYEYDEFAVIVMYSIVRSYWKTSKFFQCDSATIKNICARNNVTLSPKPYHTNTIYGVEMLDDEHNVLRTFMSQYEAAEWLSDFNQNKIAAKISRVIRGNRKGQKTCGYYWRENPGKQVIDIYFKRRHIRNISEFLKQRRTWSEFHFPVPVASIEYYCLEHDICYADKTSLYRKLIQNCKPNRVVNETTLRSIFSNFHDPICDRCKCTNEWNHFPLQFQFHHTDGDHANNVLSNIEMVCPNCHAQIENRGIVFSNNKKIKNELAEKYGRRCFQCGQESHNGQPIPLELHHKNGIRDDHENANIMLLCNNCHSQTDTYSGKHAAAHKKKLEDSVLLDALRNHYSINAACSSLGLIASSLYERAYQLIIDNNLTHLMPLNSLFVREIIVSIYNGANWKDLRKLYHITRDDFYKIIHGKHEFSPQCIPYPIRRAKHIKPDNRICRNKRHSISESEPVSFCQDCGAPISKGSNLCVKCNGLHQRKIERPNRENLKAMIRNMTFRDIARKYGVSDSTIKKWCKYYELPSSKSFIMQISDDDWKNENFPAEVKTNILNQDKIREIKFVYLHTRNIAETARKTMVSVHNVRKCCEELLSDYPPLPWKDKTPCTAKDKQGEIYVFDSVYEAALWIHDTARSSCKEISNIASNIKRTIDDHNRKTAYELKWKYSI